MKKQYKLTKTSEEIYEQRSDETFHRRVRLQSSKEERRYFDTLEEMKTYILSKKAFTMAEQTWIIHDENKLCLLERDRALSPDKWDDEFYMLFKTSYFYSKNFNQKILIIPGPPRI